MNAQSEHFLSPLTLQRLALLHQQAAHHRVLDIEGEVAAFLLAFREGSAYDSPNYTWFAGRYDRFLYIDRVVVAAGMQGQGLAHRLYQELFSVAQKTGISDITCEIDIDPPNEPSRRFHQRYGFHEVGTQWVAGGAKRVSLQLAPVGG